MNDPFLLACHVASKVCHDVIAPAGVINQTLEMLDMPLDAEARQNYEQLLTETSDAMARRLNFLRFVFGTQGLASEPANIGELKQLAEGYAGLYKPTLGWSLEATDLSHAHMRMLLLMVMIGMDGLARMSPRRVGRADAQRRGQGEAGRFPRRPAPGGAWRGPRRSPGSAQHPSRLCSHAGRSPRLTHAV